MDSSKQWSVASGQWSAHKIKVSKLRGQHFLTDARVVVKIIDAARLTPNDTVLEVGPGLGVLTTVLLSKVQRLIAVELDPYFVKVLKKEFAHALNLEIIEDDILRLSVGNFVSKSSKLEARSYKIVTNLPYNITSAFFKKFLTGSLPPISITATIQEEVANRIAQAQHSKLNTRSSPTSMLSLMCNLYAECVLITKVSAASFAPPPRVSSAVVHLRLYTEKEFVARWHIPRASAEPVLAFAARAFANPRKKLPAPYRDALVALGESPDARPAALSVQNWVKLWKIMH